MVNGEAGGRHSCWFECLLACKYIMSKGFHPVVFEAQSKVGGVWTKTLETTRIQTPKPFFQFSDFAWPSSLVDDFPTHHQVLDYITAYAHKFELLKHIKFNTKVLGIQYEGPCEDEIQSWHLWSGTGDPSSSEGQWKISVNNTQNDSTEEYTVDFVILCIGRFSDVPNIPEFPANKGPEVFEGKVIHSCKQSATEFVKGKQVSVFGFRKSALDIAMECSALNDFLGFLIERAVAVIRINNGGSELGFYTLKIYTIKL